MVARFRYGRNSELVGEDPTLAGEYAAAFVRGVQAMRDGVLRSASYLKHYTAYSVEADRFTFSAPLSAYTLRDSNLPQYEAGFAAGASGAMCSRAPVCVFAAGLSYPSPRGGSRDVDGAGTSPPTARPAAARRSSSRAFFEESGTGPTPSSCPTARRSPTCRPTPCT